jgi:hypothetical protein
MTLFAAQIATTLGKKAPGAAFLNLTEAAQ